MSNHTAEIDNLDKEERRKHVRVSCRIDVDTKTDKNWFLLNSNDISTGGMMLTTESDIKKLKKLKIDIKEKVFLSFYLPNQSDLIKVLGEVKYLKRKKDFIDKKETSFIGIQFLKETSKEIQKKLEMFVYGKSQRVWV